MAQGPGGSKTHSEALGPAQGEQDMAQGPREQDRAQGSWAVSCSQGSRAVLLPRALAGERETS